MRATMMLVLAVAPGAAFAHPGHAGGSAVGATLRHLLTEPDHLALLLLPVALAVAIGIRVLRQRRRRAAQRRRTNVGPNLQR